MWAIFIRLFIWREARISTVITVPHLSRQPCFRSDIWLQNQYSHRMSWLHLWENVEITICIGITTRFRLGLWWMREWLMSGSHHRHRKSIRLIPLAGSLAQQRICWPWQSALRTKIRELRLSPLTMTDIIMRHTIRAALTVWPSATESMRPHTRRPLTGICLTWDTWRRGRQFPSQTLMPMLYDLMYTSFPLLQLRVLTIHSMSKHSRWMIFQIHT